MPTYTKKGKKFNKLVKRKLLEIKKEFVNVFPKIEDNVVLVLNIKVGGRDFLREVV